jgi:uncharacterized SAM-binding protein YcdF (DUF218 family)
MMRGGRFRRYMVVVTGFAASLWLAGLLIFVASIENLDEPQISPDLEVTDAIVALTGGSERVMTGFELLNSRKGSKLFISGVHPGLALDHLLGNKVVPDVLRQCCIILGHDAESTRGNADETRLWMRKESYHSLRLVTANYHMPRSLIIFRATMPDIYIVPHPISPESVKLAGWWNHPGTASLLVTEYNKYLYAALRLLLGTI